MTAAASTIYKRVGKDEAVPVANGYAIYKHDPERVIFLNTVAWIVFELCDGKNTLADISTLLRDNYDLAADPEADVNVCIASLLAEGLIEQDHGVVVEKAPEGFMTALKNFFRKV